MNTFFLLMGILFGLAGAWFGLAGVAGIIAFWDGNNISLLQCGLFATGVALILLGFYLVRHGYPRAHPLVKYGLNAFTIAPISAAAVWLGLGVLGLLDDMRLPGAVFFTDIGQSPAVLAIGALFVACGATAIFHLALIAPQAYARARKG